MNFFQKIENLIVFKGLILKHGLILEHGLISFDLLLGGSYFRARSYFRTRSYFRAFTVRIKDRISFNTPVHADNFTAKQYYMVPAPC